MAEAWMDSLSEDWVSQPRSSSPRVLSRSSPISSQRPAHTPNQPQSRIPRWSKHTPITSSSLPRPTPSPTNKKRVLTERRSSEINIRPRSSSAAFTKPPSPAVLARSSSTSSVGSVVRHDSVAYRPTKSSSPNKESTPEWKRLAFRNQSGPASQQDLFAPIGLEGIFANPSSTDQDSPGRNDSFSFSEDLQNMPSSPPPWARGHKPGKTPENSACTQQPRSKLSIVQELGESSPQSNPPMSPELPKGDSRPQTAPRPTSPVAQGAQIGKGADTQPVPTPQFKLSTASGSSRQATSSVADGFSPVYISKHNADNGQIAYTAVDPSDPDVQERIRLAQSHSSRDQSQYEARAQLKATQQPQTPDCIRASDNSAELPTLSGFVSIERGGYSDKGSFRRRPLSPSMTSSNVPSESVVPSDSVSQVHLAGNSCPDTDPKDALAPQTPVQSKSVERTRSSGSPLKLFGDHDTFTNKQLLRRMSQMDDISSSSSSLHDNTVTSQGNKEINTHSKAMTDDFGSPPPVSHSPLDQDDDVDASLNKRQVPVPFKQPSPKRQRMVGQAKLGDHVADSVSEQHRRMQTVIGKKRKDALYKSDNNPCEPDQIARRQMLRPRNPTPSHASGSHLRGVSSDLEDDSFLGSVQGQQDRILDKPTGLGPLGTIGAAKVRALASEAASFRAHGFRRSITGSRKPSVSTQDFYDEAVKLMEMLRARNTMTDLTGVEEASIDDLHIEQDLAGKRLFTPQTISRPPSREGAPSAWRSRADMMPDAKVMDHLRKFEETGDESFIVASIVRSVKVAQEAAEELDEFSMVQQQDTNIRIREGIMPIESVNAQQDSGSRESGSPVKTTGSCQSTDSTGRTLNTTSSQRARTLGTIDPSKVSHLIQTETSGMRFDTEKQTWVRVKSPRKAIPQEHVVTSSSTGSDDDPLGKIPDLSVNEDIETLRVNSAGSRSTLATIDVKQPQQSEQLEREIDSQNHHQHDNTGACLAGARETCSQDIQSQPMRPEVSAIPEETRDLDYEDERGIVEDIHCQVVREESEVSARPISKTPTGTVKSKRRGPSVLFSSPPVSHLWEALHYKSSSDANCEEVDAEYSNQQPSSPDLAMYVHPPGNFLSKWQDGSTAADDFDSELSFSHVEEHREISIMEQRPGGRTMSLTLSISTPLPARRTLSRSKLQSTGGLSGGKFLRSLSPMSEFTVHQDDSKHLKSRQLQAGQPLRVKNGTLQSSKAVSTLVEKLTDAEPDEPYWDFMRSLGLSQRALETVHGLDEFCPNLEELDIAGNSLAHLSGAPHAVRNLNAQNNRLTSLTTWGHLTNLQYLNVSGNDIDSLEGFSGLLHLREIKADRNQISNLKGIEDLDGLISLSLAGNAFDVVDFHGTGLRRLSTLDMSANRLTDIRGLNALSNLQTLNVSKNQLTLFDGEVSTTQRSESLQVLDISFNELTGLGVDTFPGLQKLCADSNCLVELDGMLAHPSLRTVLLRNQRLEAHSDIFEQSFDDFRDVEHLSLSGTRLPSTLTMSQPFHGLRTLDVSFTGLQTIPAEFATLAPGVHTLNLNANAIKDIRPVRGLSRLRKLMVAGNRISRMRRVMKTFSDLRELQELDIRNNSVCAGFYGPAGDKSRSLVETRNSSLGEPLVDMRLAHLLPPADEELDAQHTARLDDEIRLKRRIFELLLGSRSPRLTQVNGLLFRKEKVMAKDQIWEQLVEIGIVEKA